MITVPAASSWPAGLIVSLLALGTGLLQPACAARASAQAGSAEVTAPPATAEVKGSGSSRRVVPAPGGPRAAPVRAPLELAQADEDASRGQKLLSESTRRVEEELDLRVFDEARAAYQACVDQLEALFGRLPNARKTEAPGGRVTAAGLQVTCRRRISRVLAERAAAERTLRTRHLARLQEVVERLPRLRSDASEARRQLRARNREADRDLSAAIDGFGRAVARMDKAFKAYPDLVGARPRTGARTFGKLRDMLQSEVAALAKDRARLRSAGDEVLLAKLRRSMRGLSPDQKKIVEQHLALPDERKRRKGGGVCYVYRRPPAVEEQCFDRGGRLVDGSGS
jgi:hypothetical protein